MPIHFHTFITDNAGEHTHTVTDHVRKSTTFWVTLYGVNEYATAGTETSGNPTTTEEWCVGEYHWDGATDPAGVNPTESYDNAPAYYEVAFIVKL